MAFLPYNEQLHYKMFIIELLPVYEHLSQPYQSGVITLQSQLVDD